MKKVLLAVTAAVIVTSVNVACAAGIADIPWNQSNIETLRSFNQADLARFATPVLGNFSGHGDSPVVKAKDIGDFTWADLAGDGHYELVMTLDVNGRAFFNALMIFRREPSGKIATEELRGSNIQNLGKVIQDLDGDGKDELIIPTMLAEFSADDGISWPMVYRLNKGQYVEASRDFPDFYEKEVLPGLDEQIAKLQGGSAVESHNKTMRAVLLKMERNKILRAIGRDPTAGLQDAREWMKSDDPEVLQAAGATFQSIGGHEDEMHAAIEAQQRALQRERASHQGS